MGKQRDITEEIMKSIDQAASQLYVAIFVLDLEEDSYIPVKSTAKINGVLQQESSLQGMMTNCIKEMVSQDSLEELLRVANIDTLRERLKGQQIMTDVFKGAVTGWCKAIFIRMDDKEPAKQVLFMVENVEDQFNRLEEQKRLLEEQQKLGVFIDSLLNEYTTVCSADFDTEEIKAFRMSKRIADAFGLGGTLPKYKELVAMYTQYAVHKDDRAEVFESMSEDYILSKIQIGESFTKVFRNNLGKYGEMKVVRTGERTIIAGFTEKHTKIMEMNDRIYTDSLTRVKNRKYYDERLVSLPCEAVVMADCDNFKGINDNQGHQCGDQALTAVAQALKRCVRDGDDIVRYGGDEFLIVFREIGLKALKKRTEEMREAIRRVRLGDYPEVRLTMSFGIAYGKGEIGELMLVADAALYESKKTKDIATFMPYEEED